MKYITFTEKGLSGISIIKNGERLSLLKLTATVSSVHSVHDYATRLVYTEALLSGAGKLSRHAFTDALSMLGSSIDVSMDGYRMHISLDALDTTLLKTLKLLEIMLREPKFDTREIRRIQEHLINNLILAKEDARGRAHNNFLGSLTDLKDVRHPFSLDVISTAVRSVSQKDLMALHSSLLQNRWSYTSGGATLSCEIVHKTLNKIHKGIVVPLEAPVSVYPLKLHPTKTLHLIDIPHKSNIEFSIGNSLAMTRTDSDFAAFYFGLSVLGIYGGFSGRLMSTVREKEGLTYGIYSGVEGVTKTETGFWRIMTFFNVTDVRQGITSTLRELQSIHDNGITADELKRFKSILATRQALIEDSLIKKVREAHTLQVIGITEGEYLHFKDSIQALTVKDVNVALKKYLNPQSIVVSGAGPVHTVKKELEQLLKK